MLVVIRLGKSQVGRSTHRWGRNIKMDLKENSLESVVNDITGNRDKWRALVNVVNVGFFFFKLVFPCIIIHIK